MIRCPYESAVVLYYKVKIAKLETLIVIFGTYRDDAEYSLHKEAITGRKNAFRLYTI